MSDIRPPARPNTIEDTGIEEGMLLNLTAKAMYTLGLERATTLSDHLKISPAIVTSVLEIMNDLSLIESRGLAGAEISSEIRYNLSDKGKAWALDATQQSQYVGPIPVTLEDFCNQVYAQRVAVEHIGPEKLAASMSHLILPPNLSRAGWPGSQLGKIHLAVRRARQWQDLHWPRPLVSLSSRRSTCRTPSRSAARSSTSTTRRSTNRPRMKTTPRTR